MLHQSSCKPQAWLEPALHFQEMSAVGDVMEKNWVLSVDQRCLQELQLSVHLISLLSTLLRWNGFVGIQKAGADQTITQ